MSQKEIDEDLDEGLDVDMSDKDSIPTREVEFSNRKWIIYAELPYPISSKIMAVFLNAAYKLGAKFSPKLIKTLIDEIVLSIVVKPAIDEEFLKSAKCPTEFVGLGLGHFIDMMESFRMMTGMLPTETSPEELDDDAMKESIG